MAGSGCLILEMFESAVICWFVHWNWDTSIWRQDLQHNLCHWYGQICKSVMATVGAIPADVTDPPTELHFCTRSYKCQGKWKNRPAAWLVYNRGKIDSGPKTPEGWSAGTQKDGQLALVECNNQLLYVEGILKRRLEHLWICLECRDDGFSCLCKWENMLRKMMLGKFHNRWHLHDLVF